MLYKQAEHFLQRPPDEHLYLFTINFDRSEFGIYPHALAATLPGGVRHTLRPLPNIKLPIHLFDRLTDVCGARQSQRLRRHRAGCQ